MLKTDSDSNIPTKKLKSLYELYQLTQLIDEATRVTMTITSLIDHFVTNTGEKISDSGVIPTSNPRPFGIEAAQEKTLVKSGHMTPQILVIFVT